MLPTLTLAPIVVEPSLLSFQRSALQELKKVDAIQVRFTGKKERFTVEVFAESTTAITDSEEPTAQGDTRLPRPTIRIERGLLEFIHLRGQVYDLAHTAHHRDPCEFCLGVLHLVVFGANPDGLLIGLLGGKRMTHTLSKFVETLLEITLQHACTDTRACCTAQTSVPHIVHAFLFTSPSDAA